MPELDSSTGLSHQVLADPTGRRRRRLAIAGRVATIVLGLWLAALMLGGLGLQPLARIPVVGGLGDEAAAPPALPHRLQAAAAERTGGAPASHLRPAPVRAAPVQAHTRRDTARTPAQRRPRARSRPVTTPRRSKPTPSPRLASPLPTRPKPKPTPPTTAPGQTRTPPGQTRTAPGPPPSTPGTTPPGHGRTSRAKT